MGLLRHSSDEEHEKKVIHNLEINADELETGDVINVAHDDEAAKYIHQGLHIDEQENKRLRRKADIYVCTFMCFVYSLQYMDKTSNSNASVMGLIEDLDMTGNRYSWVGSSFYLGYLVFEIPVSLIIQKFPLAKGTGVFVMLWGLVLALSAASQNYAGYITTRVILGALEGAITPSFLLLTSQWYKTEEQFSRVSIWFAFNGFGEILGSIIAYGLFIHNDSYSLQAWRILFIVLGLITIVLGAAFYIHIPDNPSQAWFLNEEERALQVERIRDNKQGYGSHKIKWDQVKETFIDPRTYIIFAITLLSNVPNGGLTNFANILYETMGYSDRMSLLLGLADGATEMGGCFLTAIISLYVFPKYRMLFWGNVTTALMVMCMCLLAWCPSTSGQLAGLFLNSWCGIINYTALLSIVSSNVAGTTKKSLTSAILLVGFCVGDLIGPQTFKDTEAPSYTSAKVTMAACTIATLFLYILLSVLNLWENRRRDLKNEKLPPNVINAEFADLTDFQNPEFRYAL